MNVLESFNLTGKVALVTGANRGLGQAMAVEVKKECAGHGTLVDDSCDCDTDYELDPVDAKNCIAVGAPCSGHGHEHGPGDCHCDAGFKNPIGDKSQCVPS